jgi:hypothetical protein
MYDLSHNRKAWFKDQQDRVNLLTPINVFIQLAPLPSYHLEGKNWPTCKTVKCLLKLVLLKVVLLKASIKVKLAAYLPLPTT